MRCAYGTPRDWLIGAAVVHADGRITRAGGKVVKNVAGYDFCKLYVGSFGTLAVIAEASFKLRALPSCEKTVVFYSRDAESLCSLVARITDSDVQPAAMELISPYERDACAARRRTFRARAEIPGRSRDYRLADRRSGAARIGRQTYDARRADATNSGGRITRARRRRAPNSF